MNKWIQNTNIKKGSLHNKLNIPQGKKIPVVELKKVAHSPIGSKVDKVIVTKHLKHQAQFALNVRKKK
jgi:hypothetical protein